MCISAFYSFLAAAMRVNTAAFKVSSVDGLINTAAEEESFRLTADDLS